MSFRKVLVLMLCLIVLSLSFSCVSATDYSIEKGVAKVSSNQPIEYMSIIKTSVNNEPVSIEGVYSDNEQLFYFLTTDGSKLANIPMDGINSDLTLGDMFGISEFLFNDYLNNVKFSI